MLSIIQIRVLNKCQVFEKGRVWTKFEYSTNAKYSKKGSSNGNCSSVLNCTRNRFSKNFFILKNTIKSLESSTRNITSINKCLSNIFPKSSIYSTNTINFNSMTHNSSIRKMILKNDSERRLSVRRPQISPQIIILKSWVFKIVCTF